MLAAVLLALVGSADLVRSSRTASSHRARTAAVIAIAWVAILLLALTGLGLPAWLVLVPIALAGLWVTFTSAAPDATTRSGVLPAIGLLLALTGFLIWDSTAPGASGYIVQWHTSAPSPVLRQLPLAALMLGVGLLLFLVESANIIVRSALRPTAPTPVQARATGQVAVVPAPPRTRRWWGGRAPEPVPQVADLRGGRLIGPLERVLIVALTLAGFFPIVAGLLAAKGIVRFPEISKDSAGGSKAEYFLVGSLASWTLALGAVGLLWLEAQG